MSDDDDTVDSVKDNQTPQAGLSGPANTAAAPPVAPRTSLPCTIPSAASHAPMPPNSLPLDTQHASLRRKQDTTNHQPLYSPILEKGEVRPRRGKAACVTVCGCELFCDGPLESV